MQVGEPVRHKDWAVGPLAHDVDNAIFGRKNRDMSSSMFVSSRRWTGEKIGSVEVDSFVSYLLKNVQKLAIFSVLQIFFTFFTQRGPHTRSLLSFSFIPFFALVPLPFSPLWVVLPLTSLLSGAPCRSLFVCATFFFVVGH